MSKSKVVKRKIFQDSVHGIIEFGPVMMRIVDTPEFQRLRRLHQLGLVKYVYPNCTHTRFEHSLGTYHLARRLLDSMQADPDCDAVHLSDGECLSVMVAALCHDLGHGPLSHTWERFIHQGGADYNKFKHEHMSCWILKRIVANDECLQEQLRENEVDLELVCALIRGDPTPELLTKLRKKTFIFEIVSNPLNGIDVDKWDYIMRDSFHAGFGQGPSVIEVERMLRFYRPAYCASDDAWHMSFKSSETPNVFHIFSQRQRLHHRVYSHKTTSVLETMFIDIFNALDPVLHFRDLTLRAVTGDNDALDAFLRLDEHILWAFASSQLPLPSTLPKIDENLRQSSQLCQRIQLRQLYSLVGKFHAIKITTDYTSALGKSDVLEPSELFGETSEAEDTLRNSINMERLGTEAQILDEIFKQLPPGSPIKDVRELRLSVTVQSTNSIDGRALFFTYKRFPDAFSTTRSSMKIYRYLLLWTGISQDYDATRSLRGPPPVPPCLVEALESWINEKRAR